MHNVETKRLSSTAAFVLGAYALHYVPFFAMHRSLYLHHYLPAYMLSVMATGLVVGNVLDKLVKRKATGKLALIGILLVGVVVGTVYTFMHFREIVYGTMGTSTDDLNATKRWVSTWDWP